MFFFTGTKRLSIVEKTFMMPIHEFNPQGHDIAATQTKTWVFLSR